MVLTRQKPKMTKTEILTCNVNSTPCISASAGAPELRWVQRQHETSMTNYGQGPSSAWRSTTSRFPPAAACPRALGSCRRSRPCEGRGAVTGGR